MQGKVEICGVNTARLPVLKNEEMMALLRRTKEGDRAAREQLICGNLRLVLSVIQRFLGRGENVDDLFQVGCIGLIKAIDNFDIHQNVRFSTYAVPMIIGEIRRYLDKNTVILNAAHNAAHRFPGGKEGGVLAPCAQKLPQGQDDAPLRIAVLDGAQKLLAYLHSVGGGGNAADRQAVDGQERCNAAANVAERTEVFDVGHGAGNDAARLQRVKVLRTAAALCLRAGE